MPVELRDLLSNKRWVEVEVSGHTINVAYHPSATSLRRQAELQKRLRELQAADAADVDELEATREGAQIFCEIVCDWDLTNNGQTLPIEVEVVIDLPGIVVNTIMETVRADSATSDAQKKLQSVTSGAGLPQEVRSAVAQNGISSSEARGTWA